MARVINTDVSLHRPGIERIVKQYQKDLQTFYPGIIGEEMTTKLAFDRMKAVSDFGDAQPTDENEDIPVMDIQTPFQRDFYTQGISLGYEVSAQAKMTDVYNVVKKPTENLIKSIYDAREQSGANLLNLGFTTPASGGTWTLDNVAQFSASHPINAGATVSNTSAITLGITNLESAVQLAMKSKTYMGKVWTGPRRFKLVVPHEMMMLAKRLQKSTQLPGGNDNDPNVVGMMLDVVVNPYLTDSNNWFIIPADDRHNPFFRITMMPLQLVSHKLDRRPGDEFFGYHEQYGDGSLDFRGTYGANPS